MHDPRLAADSRFARGAAPADEGLLDIRKMLGALRRRAPLIAGITALVLLATVVAYGQATRRYVATAQVVVDRRQEQIVQVGAPTPPVTTDSPTVDTEVEVLQSPVLAGRVVDTLGLVREPEFNPDLREPGTIDRLLRSEPTTATPSQARDRAIRTLIGRLDVKRDGLSYAIRVGFTSSSPERAAAIANAVVDGYVANQLDAKLGTTQRAVDLLRERLEQLRGQVLAAETAVARYRSNNRLFAASSTSSITQQELSGLNAQLAEARAAQAAAVARLGTARAQLGRGRSGEELGEALESPVVGELRAQRAGLSRNLADLSGRYGPRHPELMKAERQLADIDAQIEGEVARIVANLETQARVAEQRTASIAGSLGRSQGGLVSDSNASVRLNELERNAESARALYQAFLARFRETTAREGTEQSESRIVAHAQVPREPVSPDAMLYALIGVLAAVGLSAVAVLVAQFLASGIETGEAAERALGVPALGSIPDLASIPEVRRRRATASPTQHVVDHPGSVFAESIRALRASVSFNRTDHDARVVMVTSSLPGEGKTTVSICLARSAALSGARAVLVDCDFRHRSSTRQLLTQVGCGLAEVLDGSATLDEALVLDRASGAHLLALGPDGGVLFDRLGTQPMDALIAELRERFDFIVLDTAPVLAAAEPLVLAGKVDSVVYLVRWRKTPAKAAEIGLRRLADAGAPVAGVVLTQVDLVQQTRTGFGDAGFYYNQYKNYYANA